MEIITEVNTAVIESTEVTQTSTYKGKLQNIAEEDIQDLYRTLQKQKLDEEAIDSIFKLIDESGISHPNMMRHLAKLQASKRLPKPNTFAKLYTWEAKVLGGPELAPDLSVLEAVRKKEKARTNKVEEKKENKKRKAREAADSPVVRDRKKEEKKAKSKVEDGMVKVRIDFSKKRGFQDPDSLKKDGTVTYGKEGAVIFNSAGSRYAKVHTELLRQDKEEGVLITDLYEEMVSQGVPQEGVDLSLAFFRRGKVLTFGYHLVRRGEGDQERLRLLKIPANWNFTEAVPVNEQECRQTYQLIREWGTYVDLENCNPDENN